MTTMATEVRAESLLKELAGVWKELAKPETQSTVVRACSMTLILVTAGTGDENEIAGALGDLMHSHPGRYITLRLATGPEPEFSARVFAQCHLAFGGRQQLCCEQIEFQATRDRIPDFYAVVLGLTVPDLPVLLWLRNADMLFEPEVQALLPLARPIILDSAQFSDPAAGLEELERRRAAGWRVKDLNWTRLTLWREAVAQMFERSVCRDFAENVERIEVTDDASQPQSDAFYLAAWLAQRLPKAAVQVQIGPVRRLRLTARNHTLDIAADGDFLAATGPDGMLTKVHGAAASEAVLLAEELSILGPDPVFNATLPDALRLAAIFNHS